jgi:archaellum component FlaC
MNIDERLERLAERHEALTQTVEILGHDLQQIAQEHKEFVSRMTQYSADVKDAIARLANIAAAHEDRLDDHDKRIERLES